MPLIFFLILQGFYLMLPGIFANVVPALMKNVAFLSYPMDFGASWRGKRVLGDHKTWRGFVFGILAALIVVYIQSWLYNYNDFFQGLSVFDYSGNSYILLGLMIGLGVLLGDSVESFFKRRRGISPGRPWFPWDQLDALLGGVVFCLLVFVPPWEILLIIIIGAPLLHLGLNKAAYLLRLQKNKY